MTIIMILHIRSKYTAIGALRFSGWSRSGSDSPRGVLQGGKKSSCSFTCMHSLNCSHFLWIPGLYPQRMSAIRCAGLVILSDNNHMMLNGFILFSPVVRRNLYRVRGGDLRLSADQRLCWVPVCRGRDALIVMGMPSASYR